MTSHRPFLRAARHLMLCAALILAACATATPRAPTAFAGSRDLVLTGQVTRADWQTYKEITFDVPAGIERLTIAVSHDGREAHTTLDLGLVGPNGFRGWSGSNKTGFTLSATDATPSFSPGRVEPGRWALLIGVPAIREGVTTRFEARVTLAGVQARPVEFAAAPIRTTAGWYRGDFHAHTAHSDGSCDSLSGKRTPCPAFLTLDAARATGLDFVSVTDHNTGAQNNSLRELQGYYDTLPIVPGQEVTTLFGHANALGITEPMEFRLGTPYLPNLEPLRDRVAAHGGMLSVNHPGQPTGEACLGCGWNAPDAHPERIEAVEVINGGSMASTGLAESPNWGVVFWERLLNQGLHPTAIGGSDNHDARMTSKQSPVGMPTTVVYATNLSTAGILDGVRSGRVFIDVAGPGRRIIDLAATGPSGEARMGGTLRLAAGQSGRLRIETQGLAGMTLQLVTGNGAPALSLTAPGLAADTDVRDLALPGSATPYWVRLNVRDASGKLMLLSNPVYVRP